MNRGDAYVVVRLVRGPVWVVRTTAVGAANPTAADFVNINSMTRVGDDFVGSLNGHLDAALAVARSRRAASIRSARSSS